VHVPTKDAVRRRLRELRRERVPARDRASDAEAIAIDGLAAAHAAGVGRGDWVAAYESTPTEPPTEALVDALSARGIRVMVPITLPSWELDWREAGTTKALGREAIAEARVVFLPALGVDGAGTRMGKGKGCYDRTVRHTDALLVAVVHPWEVLEEPLPREEHDRLVDAVIAAGLGLRRLGAG
jgi:5-formyltetrahydrofolate cyclo-ligase